MSKKTLIAVVSAKHRKPWRDAIRNTWLALVPKDKADVVFFVGRGEPISEAVVELDCDDSYRGLPEKIREITRWASSQGYDFMLKCDDDTVLHPEKILACGYEQHLFSGKLNRHPTKEDPFAITVGFNYWLARPCMDIVAKAELPPELEPGLTDNDDEKWIAKTLYGHGILLHNDFRYNIYAGELKENPPSRLYRPLRPPKVNAPIMSEIFSWSVFLEANSGNAIPLEQKIVEFYKVFNMLHQKPQD